MSAAQGPIPLALKPYSPELEKEWQEGFAQIDALDVVEEGGINEALREFIKAGKLYNPPEGKPGPIEYALPITGNVEVFRSMVNAKVEISLPLKGREFHLQRLIDSSLSKSPELIALITKAVRHNAQNPDAPAQPSSPKRPTGPTHEDFENALRREDPAADLKLIRSMLDRGVQIQNPGLNFTGDLDIAIRNAAISHDVIRLLLERGAALQQPTPRDEGTLARAIRMGRSEGTIGLLIRNQGTLRRDFQSLGSWANTYSQEMKERITTLIQQAVVEREPEPIPMPQSAPAFPQGGADVSAQPLEEVSEGSLYRESLSDAHHAPESPRFCACLDDILPPLLVSVLERVSQGVDAMYRGIAYICTRICGCFQGIYQSIANLFPDSND